MRQAARRARESVYVPSRTDRRTVNAWRVPAGSLSAFEAACLEQVLMRTGVSARGALARAACAWSILPV
jgi:hypothetical protein